MSSVALIGMIRRSMTHATAQRRISASLTRWYGRRLITDIASRIRILRTGLRAGVRQTFSRAPTL